MKLSGRVFARHSKVPGSVPTVAGGMWVLASPLQVLHSRRRTSSNLGPCQLGLSGESPVFSSVAWHRLGRGGRGAVHSVETITAQTEGQSPLPSALRSSQPLRNPFQGSSPQACQWDSRIELPRLYLPRAQSCLQP